MTERGLQVMHRNSQMSQMLSAYLHVAHPTGERSPKKASANMSQRRTLSFLAATILLAFASLESAA
jgi:hypothetical protein